MKLMPTHPLKLFPLVWIVIAIVGVFGLAAHSAAAVDFDNVVGGSSSIDLAPGAKEKPNSDPLTFIPNVPIPGVFDEKAKIADETLLGSYISSFYIFFAGVAGILAVVVMIWGGFHYITSGGSPQRMNEGKDIITNAVIGLILVLTSYLLLNIINPRLTQLRLPTLNSTLGIYQPGLYCESTQEGYSAAVQAEAKCGDTVPYTINDQNYTCISLFVDGQANASFEDQQVCFPKHTDVREKNADGKYVYTTQTDYLVLKAAGTDGVCENNYYTPDDLCSRTQSVLSLQRLKGACKKADVYGTGVTLKDVCHYEKFLHCPTVDSRQVSCNVAGNRTTSCWSSENRPQLYGTGHEAIRTHCVDKSQTDTPIEYVDGLCCQAYAKQNVVCDTQGNFDEVELTDAECASLSATGGSFQKRCFTPTTLCGNSEISNCQSPKKCWGKLRMVWRNTDNLKPLLDYGGGVEDPFGI